VDKTTAGGSAVARTNIHLILNGVDVMSAATFVDAGTRWNVTYSTPLALNKTYAIALPATAADGGFSARLNNIDTFDQNNFTFEAEDFNFGGGMFFDNVVLCTTLGGGTPGLLFRPRGWTNIDKFKTNFVAAAVPLTE
jgi:hypothetical protein